MCVCVCVCVCAETKEAPEKERVEKKKGKSKMRRKLLNEWKDCWQEVHAQSENCTQFNKRTQGRKEGRKEIALQHALFLSRCI